MKNKKIIIVIVGLVVATLIAVGGVAAFRLGRSPKTVFMGALAGMVETDENSLGERVFGLKDMMERTSSEPYRLKLAVSGDSGESYGEVTINAEYAADPRQKAIAMNIGAEVGTMDLIKLGATAYQDELAIQVEPIVDSVFIFDWGNKFRDKAEKSELFPMLYSGDLDEFEANLALVKNAVEKVSDINSTNKRIKGAVDVYRLINDSIEVEKIDGKIIDYGAEGEEQGKYKTKGYSTIIPHDVWVAIVDGYKKSIVDEFLPGESPQVTEMRADIDSEFEELYSMIDDIKLVGYVDGKGIMRELNISFDVTGSNMEGETPTDIGLELAISMLGKDAPSNYIVIDLNGGSSTCFIKRTVNKQGMVTTINTYTSIDEVESDQTITFDESTNGIELTALNTVASENGTVTNNLKASGEFTRITKGKGFDFVFDDISLDGVDSATCNSVEFSYGFIDTAVKMPVGKTFNILESRQEDLERININMDWATELLGLTGFSGDMPDVDYGGMEDNLDYGYTYDGDDDEEYSTDDSNPFDFSNMGSYEDKEENYDDSDENSDDSFDDSDETADNTDDIKSETLEETEESTEAE